jgi:DNA-binding GntR family transcriptional regulator
MPCQETDPMRERVQSIALYQTRLYTMSELCARFGISRKTGQVGSPL